MSISGRFAAFASATALGVSMLAPVQADAAPKARVSSIAKAVNPDLVAARQNILDAKNPAHAGAQALKDLDQVKTNIRKAGLSPDAGEGFKSIGITQRQYDELYFKNLNVAIDDDILKSKKPQNIGIPAYNLLKDAESKWWNARYYADRLGVSESGDYGRVIGDAMIVHAREAAGQYLMGARHLEQNNPAKAYASFEDMQRFLNLVADGVHPFYEPVGETEDSMKNFRTALGTRAIRQIYLEATFTQERNLQSFRKMNGAIRIFQDLKNRYGIADDRIAEIFGVASAQDLVNEIREQSLAAANEILAMAQAEATMGKPATLAGLKDLPQIIRMGNLTGLDDVEFAHIRINNEIMAARDLMDEAARPENKGQPALDLLELTANHITTAAILTPREEKEQAIAYRNFTITNDTYRTLLGDNLLATMKGDFNRAVDPANAGKAASVALHYVDRRDWKLLKTDPSRDGLREIGVTPDQFNTLRYKQAIIAARSSLSEAREQLKKGNPEAFISLRELNRYAYAAQELKSGETGIPIDAYDIYAPLDITKTQFEEMLNQARCLNKVLQYCKASVPAPQ